MRSSPRLLLVDDDQITRSSLTLALENEGFVVHAVSDAHDGMREARSFVPDLALLDVTLEGGPDGITLARRLGAESTIPIMFVTGYSDLEHRLEGFRAGADDYIPKPFEVAELVARIHAVLRRARDTRAAVLRIGDLTIDVDGHRVSRAGGDLPVTRVEFEVLVALCRHPGRVFSKVGLLREVWGFEHYDTNLVEVHVSSLRRKLEARGPRIIHTVRGAGYVVRGL